MVYDELRRLAAARLAGEPAGHTLDATALVHEAYLRLGDGGVRRPQRLLPCRGRRHAADPGRPRPPRKGRQARRRRAGRSPSRRSHRLVVADPDLVLDIDAALDRLAAEDASSAEVARYRLFAGLSIDEAAEALGLSRATAFREWAYARSWLATALEPDR